MSKRDNADISIHNGPYRYEKMIHGRRTADVASQNCGEMQLVWCEDNLYKAQGEERSGKKYYTFTPAQALQHVEGCGPTTRNLYEFVRNGTPVYCMMDFDAYCHDQQELWDDAEWIADRRRVWYKEITEYLKQRFQEKFSIVLTNADIHVGWGSYCSSPRSFEQCQLRRSW